MRVAELLIAQDRWRDAAEVLERVELPDGRWGELRYQIGEALNDPDFRSEGAILKARSVDDPEEQAHWLRLAARILWWELEKEDQARDILSNAQRLSPMVAEEFVTVIEDLRERGALVDAHHQAQEALAVLAKSDAPLILLAWARVHAADEVPDAAVGVLKQALEIVQEDLTLWSRISDAALALGDERLSVDALAKAFRFDPGACEEKYFALLEEVASWEELASAFRDRAENAEADARGVYLLRAARVIQHKLNDPERALDVFSAAVKASPRVEIMREAYELASVLNKASVVLRWVLPCSNSYPPKTLGVAFCCVLSRTPSITCIWRKTRFLIEMSLISVVNLRQPTNVFWPSIDRKTTPEASAQWLEEAAKEDDEERPPMLFGGGSAQEACGQCSRSFSFGVREHGRWSGYRRGTWTCSRALRRRGALQIHGAVYGPGRRY